MLGFALVLELEAEVSLCAVTQKCLQNMLYFIVDSW